MTQNIVELAKAYELAQYTYTMTGSLEDESKACNAWTALQIAKIEHEEECVRNMSDREREDHYAFLAVQTESECRAERLNEYALEGLNRDW